MILSYTNLVHSSCVMHIVAWCISLWYCPAPIYVINHSDWYLEWDTKNSKECFVIVLLFLCYQPISTRPASVGSLNCVSDPSTRTPSAHCPVVSYITESKFFDKTDAVYSLSEVACGSWNRFSDFFHDLSPSTVVYSEVDVVKYKIWSYK